MIPPGIYISINVVKYTSDQEIMQQVRRLKHAAPITTLARSGGGERLGVLIPDNYDLQLVTPLLTAGRSYGCKGHSRQDHTGVTAYALQRWLIGILSVVD